MDFLLFILSTPTYPRRGAGINFLSLHGHGTWLGVSNGGIKTVTARPSINPWLTT
jgi:hypothetical protein